MEGSYILNINISGYGEGSGYMRSAANETTWRSCVCLCVQSMLECNNRVLCEFCSEWKPARSRRGVSDPHRLRLSRAITIR